jgi:hypothetical protein
MAAAFVKEIGYANNKSAGTTLAATTFGAATTAGNLIVACAVFDNAATASKPVVSSFSKPAAETASWVFLGAARSTSTSAGAFASGEMWCIRTTVSWPTSTSITVTLDTSVTMKAIQFAEYSGVLQTLRSTVGTAYSTTTTAASVATTGTTPVVGDLAVGFVFGSNVASGTGMNDTDTLGGNWGVTSSQGVGSTGGNVATNNMGHAHYKVLNAASHQTLNASGSMTAGNGAIVAVLQAAPVPAITQAAYGFFDDAGTEAGAAPLAAVNTAITANTGNGDQAGVLRVQLQLTTAVATDATDDWALQYSRNGGAWSPVGPGTTTVQSYNNPNLTDGAATTNRLGAGTGSFVAGEISETGGVTDLGWSGNNYTELVYSLKLLAANLTAGDTLTFRVLYNNATTLMTYSAVPTINVVRIVTPVLAERSTTWEVRSRVTAATRATTWNVNVTSGTPSSYVGFRTFDGTGRIQVAVGESTDQTLDSYSQFALVRPTAVGGGASHTWITANRAANRACYWYLNWTGWQETDAQSGYTAGSGATAPTVAEWSIIGITKAAGANPIYHRCVMSTGVWTHESGGGLPAVAPIGAGGSWWLGWDGSGDEPWVGDIAVESFHDRPLTTLEVEALDKGLSKWRTGSVHVWPLDRTTVNDIVGTANQIAVTNAPIGVGSSPLPNDIVAPLYGDNFNRANGALAAPWVVVEGSQAVTSNKLNVAAGGPHVSRYNQTFSADQWAEGDVTGWVEGGSSIGPAVRINGSDLVYVWFSNIPARVAIWKRVGGTYTQIASSVAAAPSTAAFTARLEVQGTTYRAYVDGALVASGTDPEITTGQPGVLGANGGGATLDNWRGGDLPYSAPIYTDNFNRADGNLEDFVNWVAANAHVHITSNHLDIDSSGCADFYIGAVFPATSHWSEGLMTIQDGQEGSLGPSVRQGAGENSYYSWLRGTNNPPTFEIWRQWAGYVQVGNYAIPVPAAKTGPVTVAMEVDGTTIRGYVEGVKAIEWVETDPGNGPNGNRPGVNGGMFGATNGLVQMDDWRGGPGRYPGLAGAGGGTTPVSTSRSTTWNVAAASLTPVSTSRATTWAAQARVTATRATTWEVERSVVGTRATTWTVRTPVSASRATTWTTKVGITSSRATTWTVTTPVTAVTRATTWAVRTAVTTSRATTWTVTVPVGVVTRATTWVTSSPVVASQATTWAVAAGVVATRSTTWNVAGSFITVQATRSTSWGVIGSVTATRATTWSALAGVQGVRASTWVVLLQVAQARATTWTVRTPVTASRATTWVTKTITTGTRATTWNTSLTVTPTRATTWTVGTPVATSRATTWSVAARITPIRATTWTVTTPVSATRASTWAVSGFITSTRASTWSVAGNLTFVLTTRATTWTARAVVMQTRVATWITAVPVTPATRGTTWFTRSIVATSRATTWANLLVVPATRATTWVTRAPVTSSRATTWAVRAFVTGTRATTWNIGAAFTQVSGLRSSTWTVRSIITGTRATTWTVCTPLTTSRATTWRVRITVQRTVFTTWNALAGITTASPTTWRILREIQATRTTAWTVYLIVLAFRTTSWSQDGPPFIPVVQHHLAIHPTTEKMYLGTKPIKAIYQGEHKLWESV